jgi:hypothetical protein
MPVTTGDAQQLASVMEEIRKIQQGRDEDRARADEDRAEYRARIAGLESVSYSSPFLHHLITFPGQCNIGA